MAKRQIVSYSYTCDLGGEEIPDSTDGGSRKISWEGSDYIVDVCSSHGGELSEILDRLKAFVDAGQRQAGRRRPGAAVAAIGPRRRQVAGGKSETSAKRPGGGLSAVRTWAREHGHSVNARGRIPATVMAAYQDAHSAPASAAEAPAPKPAPKKRAARRPRKPAGAAK